MGLGPGAHSRVSDVSHGHNRNALVNIPSPDRWMSEVDRVGHGVKLKQNIDVLDSVTELLATGLRTTSGISESDWNRVCDGHISMYTLYQCLCSTNIKTGIILKDGYLRVTPDKICILDSLLPHVFNALDLINEQII